MVTLGEMMRQLGLDVGPESDVFLPIGTQIADTCLHCRKIEACREWLARKPPAESYRAFCPNAEAFDFLRRRKGLDAEPIG